MIRLRDRGRERYIPSHFNGMVLLDSKLLGTLSGSDVLESAPIKVIITSIHSTISTIASVLDRLKNSEGDKTYLGSS